MRISKLRHGLDVAIANLVVSLEVQNYSPEGCKVLEGELDRLRLKRDNIIAAEDARKKRRQDPYRLKEMLELAQQLDNLLAYEPSAFELCIDTGSITYILDELQGNIDRIIDESRGVA